MNRKRRMVAASLLGGIAAATWCCGGGATTADGDSATNSTVITARHLDYDYPKRTAVFEGDVVVVDPRVKIIGDTITAVFMTNNQPESVTAVGNVRIEQTNRVAVCNHAFYSVKSGLLVLPGKPIVSRGTDVLSGTRITFNRDTDKMECTDAKLIVAPGAAGLNDFMK